MKTTSLNPAFGGAMVLLCSALAGQANAATQYVQHNLVSDLPGVADQTDPNLVNPWGIALSATSPFWIADNHSGTTTVYDGQGHPAPSANPLVVQIPAPPNVNSAASPTGAVFNDTQAFNVSGNPAVFLFATEDGTISGWNSSGGPGSAVLLVDNSSLGAVYKGLALANTIAGPMLYAANFGQGTIDVFDGNLTPVATSGAFADPNLTPGFAPFNVQRIGRKLYVTYAMQDGAKHDDVAGSGNGFVDVFDFNGNLLNRLISNGPLNSPWGLTLAPATFGDFSSSLLVGNFGDGTINAFDPCNGDYLGSLQDGNGANITIAGLWGLAFGNGRSGGDATALYFTAGTPGPGNVEDHGLFGTIQIATSAPASAPAPQQAPISISNFAFAPQAASIAVGSGVQWTNQDGTAHTVVADKAQFSSAVLNQNDTFSQTFNTPGTYSYHCSIHPFMKGTIVVK